MKCIEHGTVMDRETAELIKERGVFVVPILTISEMLRRFPGEWGMTDQMLADLEWLDAAELKSVRLLAEVGVEMSSGLDLIGAAAAIDSATRVNAKIMRIDDRVGTIEPSKLAHPIVYQSIDPVANPELFMSRRPDFVLLAGSVVRHSRTR
ncbi:MAG: hypothetical protein ACTIJ6_09815 [Leucobacter sp.]